MKIILNNRDLSKTIRPFKDIGFVPTMGGIHKGHISLIRRSIQTNKKTIVSIFINPKQFNNIKDKYFLMLLTDDLIIKKNCSKSMIGSHKKYKASVMASMNVNKKNVERWGIYKLKKKLNKTDYLIDSVVEKPNIKDAPSNKAVIGRYILPKKIFSKLKNLKPSKGGEIHITDAIQLLINSNEKFIAHNFSGKYLDCGTMDGYINSSKEIAKL